MDWVRIYFTKQAGQDLYRCNMCQFNIHIEEDKKKTSEMLEHIQAEHKEVIELHKGNPDESVGFRIEFLQLNMLGEEEPKTSTVDVTAKDLENQSIQQIGEGENVQYILVNQLDQTTVKKVKINVNRSRQQAKRSWVWKYFENISSVIYRCNLCNVVLSIKGNNTNNMNRHVKSKHPVIYKAELMSATYTRKKDPLEVTEVGSEVEIMSKGNEAVAASTAKAKGEQQTPAKLVRRSWIWTYFTRLTSAIAQCKLCNRKINHGGNATGNMHRHLKFLHKDVYMNSINESERSDVEEVNWIWRLFSMEDKAYSCKICDYKCQKNTDLETNIQAILYHLRSDHGVISGDQIITGPEYDATEMDECSVAVDFLKGSEM